MSTPTQQELQNQIRDAVIRAKLEPSTANKDRVFTLWRAYQNQEYRIPPQFLPAESPFILHVGPEHSQSGLTNTSTWAVYNWTVLAEVPIHLGGFNLLVTGTTAFNTNWDQALGLLLQYREHAQAPIHTVYRTQIKDGIWDVGGPSYRLHKTIFFPSLLEIPAHQDFWWGFYNFTGQTVSINVSLLTLEDYSFL